MSRRVRRVFSEEFKAQAVDLVRQSGKSPRHIAKDLDLTERSLRDWVKKADGQSRSTLRHGSKAAPSALGREEVEALRREVKTLRMERDFLKKAAAFFARETT